MLTETRKKLLKDIHLLVPNADKNQIASTIGIIGETILCNRFGWQKFDGDGYDAIDLDCNLYEIKTMSNESTTKYVAYNHKRKKNRYDYLVIYHYDLNRVTVIPRKAINKFFKDTKSTLLRLDFNDTIFTKLGKPRQSARFQALFQKYEKH